MQPEEQKGKSEVAHANPWEGRFSAMEWMRLLALRQRLARGADLRELDVNIGRLEFACWLVKHGILNEG